MASIFTQIIDGNIPGHFVWRDATAVAIMTIQPVRPGHLLVIPRAEIDHWDQLPAETLAHLLAVSQKITQGLKQAFPATRVGLLIAGLEVPHTHIHLAPLDTMADLDLSRAVMAAPEELAAAAEKIRQALMQQGCEEARLLAD